MHSSSSSSGCGLHSGVRVQAPASTSSSAALPWRSLPLRQPRRCRQHQQQQQHHHHHLHHHQQQQRWWLSSAAAAAAGSSSNPSGSSGGGSSSSSSSSQAFRFRHLYDPAATSQLPSGSWAGWPVGQDGVARATVIGEGPRIDPEQALWQAGGAPGSARLRNPWAQHFRVTHVPSPVAPALPGSDTFHVEMLNNYSRNWPSLKWVDGRPQLRLGFLEPFDDPKVVPFFFYRGLETVAYSWSDRAFQALFAVVYAGVHAALFGWVWSWHPSLAAAVALNWGLGKLSLAKWAILLLLMFNGRLWLYWLWLAGSLVDAALARLFPPVREFAVAMFTMWLLFVAVSPNSWHPLPFAPFAPGTLGPREAVRAMTGV